MAEPQPSDVQSSAHEAAASAENEEVETGNEQLETVQQTLSPSPTQHDQVGVASPQQETADISTSADDGAVTSSDSDQQQAPEAEQCESDQQKQQQLQTTNETQPIQKTQTIRFKDGETFIMFGSMKRRIYMCKDDDCTEWFYNATKCKRHVVTHEQYKHLDDELDEKEVQYPCHVCVRTFSTKDSLRHHMKTHRIPSTGKSLPCSWCNLMFSTHEQLTNHQRSKHKSRYTDQDEQMSIVCNECGNQCGSYKELDQHQREVHPGEHKCGVCSKRFPTHVLLTIHTTIHTQQVDGDERYRCLICERSYTNPATFGHHLRVHVGKVKCKQCDKAFQSNAHLRAHLITHTKQRDWRCSTCGLTFMRPESLEKHEALHTADSQLVQKIIELKDVPEHKIRKKPQRGRGRPRLTRPVVVETGEDDSESDVLQQPDENEEEYDEDQHQYISSPAARRERAVAGRKRKRIYHHVSDVPDKGGSKPARAKHSQSDEGTASGHPRTDDAALPATPAEVLKGKGITMEVTPEEYQAIIQARRNKQQLQDALAQQQQHSNQQQSVQQQQHDEQQQHQLIHEQQHQPIQQQQQIVQHRIVAPQSPTKPRFVSRSLLKPQVQQQLRLQQTIAMEQPAITQPQQQQQYIVIQEPTVMQHDAANSETMQQQQCAVVEPVQQNHRYVIAQDGSVLQLADEEVKVEGSGAVVAGVEGAGVAHGGEDATTQIVYVDSLEQAQQLLAQ